MIAYTYFGYAGWLWVSSRWFPKAVKAAPYTPLVSVVMVVRNEDKVLDGKLRNLMALDYPADLIEIVVASDGSTDAYQRNSFGILDHETGLCDSNPESRGKAAGINAVVGAARGEIIVFNDARQKIEASAVRLLVENFAILPSVAPVAN